MDSGNTEGRELLDKAKSEKRRLEELRRKEEEERRKEEQRKRDEGDRIRKEAEEKKRAEEGKERALWLIERGKESESAGKYQEALNYYREADKKSIYVSAKELIVEVERKIKEEEEKERRRQEEERRLTEERKLTEEAERKRKEEEEAKRKRRNTALWSGLVVIGAIFLIIYVSYRKGETPQVPPPAPKEEPKRVSPPAPSPAPPKPAPTQAPAESKPAETPPPSSGEISPSVIWSPFRQSIVPGGRDPIIYTFKNEGRIGCTLTSREAWWRLEDGGLLYEVGKMSNHIRLKAGTTVSWNDSTYLYPHAAQTALKYGKRSIILDMVFYGQNDRGVSITAKVKVPVTIAPNAPQTMVRTIVLQPDFEKGKDIWTTSVYSYAPGGGGPGGGLANEWLQVGGWGDFYLSLIEFNLTSLPSVALSAKIELFVGENKGEGTCPMYLEPNHDILGLEDAGTGVDRKRLWWVDRPSAVQWESKPLPAPDVGQWYSIDITHLYNSWQKGTYSNYGVQLRPTLNSNRWNMFYSSRAT